eukprot:gene3601-4125_t
MANINKKLMSSSQGNIQTNDYSQSPVSSPKRDDIDLDMDDLAPVYIGKQKVKTETSSSSPTKPTPVKKNNASEMSDEDFITEVETRIGHTLQYMMVNSAMLKTGNDLEKTVELVRQTLAEKAKTSAARIATKNEPGTAAGATTTTTTTTTTGRPIINTPPRPLAMIVDEDEVDADEKTWFANLADAAPDRVSDVIGVTHATNKEAKEKWNKLLVTLEKCALTLPNNAMLLDNTPLYFVKSKTEDGHPPNSILAISQEDHRFVGYLNLPRVPPTDLNVSIIPLLRSNYVRLLGTAKLLNYQNNRLAAETSVLIYLTYKSHIRTTDRTMPAGQDENYYTQRVTVLQTFLQQVLVAGSEPLNAQGPEGEPKELTNVDFIRTNMRQMNPHPYIQATLRTHQKEGLYWMMHRERNPSVTFNATISDYWRKYRFQDGTDLYYNNYSDNMFAPKTNNMISGGLLADDMGLGKTVMSIALILSNHPLITSHPQHTEIFKDMRASSPMARRRKELPKCTLVICNSTLVKQWAEEIEKFVSEQAGLKVKVYHLDRKKQLNDFYNYDVVITTHGIFGKEWRDHCNAIAEGGRSDVPPLHNIYWWRIILDEAQVCKKTTQLFDALQNIQAVNRWCLTGTPVQNYLDEMFPHLHFLNVHPIATNIKNWRVYIEKPMNIRLLRSTLKPILLRRTKDHVKVELNLPPKDIELVELKFNEEEEAYYAVLFDQTLEQFNKLLRKGAVFKNYETVELCIICEEPLVQPTSNLRCEHKFCFNCIHEFITNENEQGNDRPRCPVCFADLEVESDKINKDLKIEAKKEAKKETLQEQQQRFLNRGVNQNNNIKKKKKEIVKDEEEGEGEEDELVGQIMSTKLLTLMEEMNNILTNERDAKIVIFSQWTSMLDLIEKMLEENDWVLGDKYLRYDGRMNPAKKHLAIKKFNQDGGPVVMLTSLKAGGVGLNLTRANKVFMVDPWWNVASENQAIDRVHRMGQTRKVTVKKFIIKNSIEVRILELQQSKTNMSDAVLDEIFDPDKETKRYKLSLDDIKELFRGFNHNPHVPAQQYQAMKSQIQNQMNHMAQIIERQLLEQEEAKQHQ